jgi:hypothetical protein
MRKINFFLAIFISLLIIQPLNILKNPVKTSILTNPSSSQIPVDSIHIAIYDEPNVTRPFYSSTGLMTNNHTLLNSIFSSVGYDVSFLSVVDISNHELMTAKYDVFVINDNLPRENITEYVKEFWLGGGSLLTFDSAISYLCYFGILPPESDGDEGYGIYWNYQWSENQSIFIRHPVSKAYEVSDIININYYDWATFSWTALLGTSIASQLTRIATIDGDTNSVTILGFDPKNQGGKVLHFLGSQEFTGNQLLVDAIDWLCPRPKGRVLFDLSHYPYYGIDLWDLTYVDYAPRYEILRDNLVNRSYTIDKLYPSSSGNLTANNLANYDILFLALSTIPFTPSEIQVVTNWVNNGGSILAFGETTTLTTYNMILNDLFVNFDLRMNITNAGTGSALYTVNHPTIEGCTQLTVVAPGKIVIEGDSYPIWGADVDNIFVAGQDYGKGRILLISDVAPFRDSTILTDDNLQYGINVMNWLTADDAKVLIFVHNPAATDPNDNIYRGPVANALNDLGRSFYMTFTEEYLNLSLSTGSYKLVVIDNSEFSIMDTVGITLLNFLKTGGYLIISTYEYRLASYNYLWDYIGITYADNYFTTPQSINIWTPSHSIFSSPVKYSASTLETSLDFINTDFTYLTLHSNATAIAGLTLTPHVNGSAIILGANKHVITNAMHLTEYYDDTDDDTYPDALQLWENEIAYMLARASPRSTTKIPSYDIFIILELIFVSVGLISVVIIKKRKNIIF